MPSQYGADLAAIATRAIERLTRRNQAREQALAISREVIRFSANAIRAVHRADLDEAKRLIEQAGQRLKEAEPMRQENPDIYFAGFLSDARKEYAEANVTFSVISGGAIPGPEDLGMDPSPYLNGVAEAIGEFRRYILDELRRDSFDRCQDLMEVMDEIFGILVTVDFPEGVTGGLRHTTDMMRGVLERTRGDLTMALRQHKLELQMADWDDHRSDLSHD